MLVAKAMDLDSCPMGGFDPGKLDQCLNPVIDLLFH